MRKGRDSLLWQIEAPGTRHPSFLFGTMHVRDEKAYGWFPLASRYLLQCDCLALEIDLNTPPSPEWLMRLQLPPGSSLRELLGERLFEKGCRILQKAFGLDLRLYNHSLPMLVVQAIDSGILVGEEPVALDEALFHLAQEQGKAVIGLETLESQARLLSRIPLSDQVRQLKKVIRSVSNHRRSLLRFARLYEEGRLDRLYQAARRGAGSLRREMIYSRNRNMVREMHRQMADRSLFAAVGAGHLPGKEGMLRLLKHDGCRLIPKSREDLS